MPVIASVRPPATLRGNISTIRPPNRDAHQRARQPDEMLRKFLATMRCAHIAPNIIDTHISAHTAVLKPNRCADATAEQAPI